MIAAAPSSKREAVAQGEGLADSRGRWLRDLRLSVIDRCNLRCQYCMPADVFGEDFRFRPLSELLTFDQLTAIAAAFIELGVSKIRLTGGEPLLRPDLPALIRQLRALDDGVDLALTTNGLRLAAMADKLREAGLNRVNVSLDALDPEVAARMAWRPVDPQRVIQAIETAQACGLGVKVNTVIKRGVNDSQIVPLAKLSREIGVTLRYIEYMDVGSTNRWQASEVVTGTEIRQQLKELSEVQPLPGEFGDVARNYRYTDGAGEVGFIESVSRPFCGSCTRARVSAEGTLYTCLFSSHGLPLKPLLAQGNALPALITKAWRKRDDRYSELRKSAKKDSVHPEEMWRLGG